MTCCRRLPSSNNRLWEPQISRRGVLGGSTLLLVSRNVNCHEHSYKEVKSRNLELDLVPKSFFEGNGLPILQKFYFQYSFLYWRCLRPFQPHNAWRTLTFSGHNFMYLYFITKNLRILSIKCFISISKSIAVIYPRNTNLLVSSLA